MSITTKDKSVHTKRIPVSSNRAPLKVRGFDQANQVGRWVNDIEDRIAKFLEGGYRFINQDGSISAGENTAGTASMVDSRVTKRVGRGVVAYLMALPRDLWEEDQKAKMREVDAMEAAIRRPGKGAVSEEVDYGNVSITSGTKDEKVDFKEVR